MCTGLTFMTLPCVVYAYTTDCQLRHENWRPWPFRLHAMLVHNCKFRCAPSWCAGPVNLAKSTQHMHHSAAYYTNITPQKCMHTVTHPPHNQQLKLVHATSCCMSHHGGLSNHTTANHVDNKHTATTQTSIIVLTRTFSSASS